MSSLNCEFYQKLTVHIGLCPFTQIQNVPRYSAGMYSTVLQLLWWVLYSPVAAFGKNEKILVTFEAKLLSGMERNKIICCHIQVWLL